MADGPLQRHLRRLRRPVLVPADLFQRPVRALAGRRRFFTAACVFAGSFIRPFGGALADRFGGVSALTFVYGLSPSCCLIAQSRRCELDASALPIMLLIDGGAGRGQWRGVPARAAALRRKVGVVTGLVGVTGGVGGFYLASSLGCAKQFTGGYGPGLRSSPALALAALTGLHRVDRLAGADLAQTARRVAVAASPAGPRPSCAIIPEGSIRSPTSSSRRVRRLVIIGNGMAPGRALEQLFEAAPDAYEVTIFNAEPRVNYDRIMLSPVLSGEKAFEDIVIHGDGWYIKHGITLYKGHKIDRHRPRGARRSTSRARRRRGLTTSWSSPPARRHSSAGARARTSPACSPIAISTTSTPCCSPRKSRGKAVVIGGGLLGLEAAAGLKEQRHGRHASCI